LKDINTQYGYINKKSEETSMKKVYTPKSVVENVELNTYEDVSLHLEIDANISMVKSIFDNCSDVVFREFLIDNQKSYLIYIDGLIDSNSVQLHALQQLFTDIKHEQLSANLISQKIVSISSINEVTTIKDVALKVLDGDTLLMVDQLPKALVFDAKGGQKRNVSEPDTETSIRGPREGFTESLRVNTALIRQKVRSNRLKSISKEVGRETRTKMEIMYIEGLAKPDLVKEIIERIDRIDIDGILESGYIEELIEDNPWSFFPQIQNTERPDTVAGNLLEGRVAIVMDGTPFTLLAPATFWQFLQASEDYYNRYHISIFLRLLRITFIFLALLLPAFYIAITTYHQEMIPTNLLSSIAATRESIPFPAFVEALIMEIAFEALREAGIRLPKVVGQAVSILGALVIGQAAVEAGIVSAPMVIVVSLTGIASITVPRFNMAISIRLLRFPMMLLASAFGLFGVLLGTLVLFTHLCKLRSFGVPYFSPLAPLNWKELKDVFIRVPWWAMNKRPQQFIDGNFTRQAPDLMPSTKQQKDPK